MRRNIKKNKRSIFVNRVIFVMTLFIVCFILFSVQLVANAKEDKPTYKYYQSYMVEKDDTLYSIAKKMNVEDCSEKLIKECVNEMISINSLDHKGTICYGNYIIVPYYSYEYR